MTADYRLYGAEFSLYSGKVRAYLRKKGIPFEEINASLRVYKKFIIPRTGVKYIPVVQTPDDQVYQDTTVIIDALEQRFPEPSVYPATPLQKLIALLLEVYGDEWLLLYAMHYRWNYPATNYRFVIGEFGKMLLPGWPGFIQRWLGKRVGGRFHGAVAKLGVSEHNRAAIESSYRQLLADLQAHFSQYDYLLGKRPSIADFGFIGPFYAHLYRDPYPGKILRTEAPAVAAWVERMHSTEPVTGAFLPDDEIPATLLPVLRRMASEQLPVLLDTEQRLTQWRSQNPAAVEIPRSIGSHAFKLEGVSGERVILPYSLWMFQRALKYYQRLLPAQQAAADQLLADVGFADAMRGFSGPRLIRRDNRLYFAD